MDCIKYIIPLLLLGGEANAQSFFSDLFGQAGKQKSYYLQQIAAYNALRAEMKQGYGVIKHGLNGIRNINTGELNAHTAYYTALKTPSSSVKNNNQVKDIVTYQTYINAIFNRSYSDLTSDELNYVASVKTNVLTACDKDITDLQNLLAAGKLQMSDDRRLKRLNAIHISMLDKFEFSQSFSHSLTTLAIRRQQEKANAQTLTNLYARH
jgi:hypothetical protein